MEYIIDENFFDLVSLQKMQRNFDEVIALFKKFGSDQYMISEQITQLDHAIQAAELAFHCGAPTTVIVGLLLHDIGQLEARNRDPHIDINLLHKTHDDVGFLWLKDRNMPEITCLIAKYHTATKIILCRELDFYFDKLSQASKDSYLIQVEKYKDLLENKDKYTSFYKNIEILKACRLCDEMAKINSKYNLQMLDSYRDKYENIEKYEIDMDNTWIDNVHNLYKNQR